MIRLPEEQLQGFACARCGTCCKIPNGIVRLDDEAIAAIASELNMSQQEFIDQHTDVSPDRRCLILKNTSDGVCAMLSDQGSCTIYPARPMQCRTFPYEWVNEDSLESCAGLRNLKIQ